MSATFRTSRRAFLARTSLIVGGYLLPALPTWAFEVPRSPLAKRIVRTPENTYFTYPHSHGFLDGSCVVASPAAQGSELTYLSVNLDSGKSSALGRLSGARMYYAISGNGLMAYTRRNGVSVLDLTRPGAKPRDLMSEPEWTFHADCDISDDGKTVLVTRSRYEPPKIGRLEMIDVESGKATTLVEGVVLMDHAHFSPYDPSWISYCCASDEMNTRIWVWHSQHAPKGRRLFNQVKSDGTRFAIGHERAMFNKLAMVVIAYGSHSSARPCGLYELGFDGSVRLVSESMRDLHCNVSRDGRWAVVSLQGTHDLLAKRAQADWIDQSAGYGFSDVMMVNMRTGARQYLYRGTNSAKSQPYEVQPSISPDGRWVVLKDASERRVIGVEIDQQALASFLA